MGFLPGGIGWQRKEAGNDGGKFPVRRGTSAVHSGRKLFAESFPTRRDSSAVHGGRKLFAESFPTRRGSSAVHGGRKLFAESFPTRRGSGAVHGGRKLFAESFPLAVAAVRFMAAGNDGRKVSCPARHHGGACRQERVCYKNPRPWQGGDW